MSGSTDKETPLFCLNGVQSGYKISDCQKNDQALVATRLELLASLRWIDIQESDYSKHGYEKIETGSLRKALPLHVPEDARVISFRFGSGQRIVGYRDRSILRVLWVDPNHEIYSG